MDEISMHHIGIVSEDLNETTDFFKELLGLNVPSSGAYSNVCEVNNEDVELSYVMLKFDSQDFFIEVFEPVRGPHRKMLDEHGNNSIAEFCVESDSISDTYDRFSDMGINIVDDGGNSLIEKKYVEFPTGSRGFYLAKEETGNHLVEVLQPYYNV